MIWTTDEAQSADCPERAYERAELVGIVADVLRTLDHREAAILRMKFGIGVPEMTRAEVAGVFGCSASRIGQVEHRALRKLRHPSRAKRMASHAPWRRTYLGTPWEEE